MIGPMRPDRLVQGRCALRALGPQPGGRHDRRWPRATPSETMIVDELGTLTFDEVHRRTNALAHVALGRRHRGGRRRGDHVPQPPRLHRVHGGVSKLGGDALYLNTAFAGPQLADVVKREKPAAIIFDEEFDGLLDEAGRRRKRFVAWHDSETAADPTLDELIANGDPADVVPPSARAASTILTSGTTGTPKGAARGNPQSIEPGRGAALAHPAEDPRDQPLSAAPLFHSWGFAHFTLGPDPRHHLRAAAQVRPGADAGRRSRAPRDGSIPVVPVMVQRIMELPEETRDEVRPLVAQGRAASGSALPGELANKWMDEFGDNLYNLYGSTEVAWAIDRHARATCAPRPERPGKPPRGTDRASSTTRTATSVPAGEHRPHLRGQRDAVRGLHRRAARKDVIDGLMATGDIGRFDDAGPPVRGGPRRRDDRVGRRERLPRGGGGPAGAPRRRSRRRRRSAWTTRTSASGCGRSSCCRRARRVSEDELKDYVKRNLARYKVPREIVFLDELPRNATGKVLKRELKELNDGAASKASRPGADPGRGRGPGGRRRLGLGASGRSCRSGRAAVRSSSPGRGGSPFRRARRPGGRAPRPGR